MNVLLIPGEVAFCAQSIAEIYSALQRFQLHMFRTFLELGSDHEDALSLLKRSQIAGLRSRFI